MASYPSKTAFWTQWKIDGIVCVLLILASLLFFYEPLFTLNVGIHWDAYDIHYPELLYASRELQDGRVPLWNPYIFCGYPFIGNPQSGSFYPAHFIPNLFRDMTPVVLAYITVLHYIIAILGAFFFSRILGSNPPGACIAALAYGFSSQVLGHSTHMGILEYLSLLPWMLSFITLGQRKSRWEFIGLAGVLTGFGSLGGHFQTSMYGFSLCVLWILLNPCLDPEQTGQKHRIIRSIGRLAVFAFMTVAVSGVHFFSTAELATTSTRSGISYRLASTEALKLKSLTTILLPDAFGGLHKPYWGAWSRGNQQGYAGILTLLLAGVMLFQKKNRYFYCFAGIIVFGILFALGNTTPVHRWTLKIVPGWGLVRTPSAILPFVALSLAVIAGMGMSALSRKTPSAKSLAVPLGTVALAGIVSTGIMLRLSHLEGSGGSREQIITNALKLLLLLLSSTLLFLLYRRKRSTLFLWLMPLLLFGDIFWAHLHGDLLFGRSNPYERTKDRPIHAIINTAYETDPYMRIHEWDLRSVLQDNEAERRKYYATLGRISGLHPKRVGILVRMAEFNRQILSLLRVRYVLVSDTPEPDLVLSTTPVNPAWKQWHPRKELERISDEILENPDPFPIVFPVTQWRVETDTDTITDLLTRTDFKSECILEQVPDIPESLSVPDHLEVTGYSPHRVAFQYRSAGPCLFVVTDTYFAGWHAYVDNGAEIPVYRANMALRAIIAPPGDHTITMRFMPRAYRPGLFMSCLGLLIMVMAIITLI